jgi:hypothetical protein
MNEKEGYAECREVEMRCSTARSVSVTRSTAVRGKGWEEI